MRKMQALYSDRAIANVFCSGHKVYIMLGIAFATVLHSAREVGKHNDLFSWAQLKQLANNLDRAL